MPLIFDVSEDELKVFLQETDENLQTIEDGIVHLEKQSSDMDLLHAIFRAAHTIKGASATIGHQPMANVTHAMENTLDKLRKGTLSVSSELVDILFASLDVLRAFRDEIATGQESGIQIGEVVARLKSVEAETTPDAAKTASVGAVKDGGATQAAMVGALSPDELAKIEAGKAEGLIAVELQVTIDPNCAMPAVRAFQLFMTLMEVGETVRSWPSQAEVEADQIKDSVRVILLTPVFDHDLFKQAVSSVDDLSLNDLQPYGVAGMGAAAVGVAESATVAAASTSAAAPPTQSNSAPSAGEKTVVQRGAVKSGRTVRVDVEVLDDLMNLVGELVMDRTRLIQANGKLETLKVSDDLAELMASISAHLGRTTVDLQEVIQKARMQPVDVQFKKFPRLVRDTAQKAGKEIEFVMLGEDTELDRSVIEEIGDPIMHSLRNAIDHGVELPDERERQGKPRAGQVVLEAMHQENSIIISIRDDGHGINPDRIRASAVKKGLLSEEQARKLSDDEAVKLIWAPGFSTADKVSDISGRGVGLDVVHKNIERLNGTVDIITEVGKGTEFRIRLPLTLMIMRALQVQVSENIFCIPLNNVADVDRVMRSQIQKAHDREVIIKRGEVIPLVRLADVFKLANSVSRNADRFYVVYVSHGGRQVGLMVDKLVEEAEVVIKPLGLYIGEIPGLSGATIMGDGDVALILDIGKLAERAQGAEVE